MKRAHLYETLKTFYTPENIQSKVDMIPPHKGTGVFFKNLVVIILVKSKQKSFIPWRSLGLGVKSVNHMKIMHQ
jgi:hypothetical protein